MEWDILFLLSMHDLSDSLDFYTFICFIHACPVFLNIEFHVS